MTPHRSRWTAALALGATMLAAAHAAGPAPHRLEIGIDYVRQAALVGGVERGRSRLVQTLAVGAVLQGDGVPMMNNPLDPEDGQRQLERGQRTQQRVQAALARQGGAAAATAPDMAAMQARAQQMQARCGQDRDCLMREAMALSAVQAAGGHAGVQQRLEGYGAAVQACERRHAAATAREACIATARRQAGGGDDGDDGDEVVETPYLFYRGHAGCRFDAALKLDERIEGQFDDVQGVVPFTHTVQAEQRQRDDVVCPLVQAVLDTRNGRLWTRLVGAVREAPAVTVRSERGRKPQRSEGSAALQWREADAWLQQRLLRLDAGGADSVRLPAGADGQVELRLKWRFAPA